jgi:CRP/FNR family cyclic AMP-dependent transcriptional regulator
LHEGGAPRGCHQRRRARGAGRPQADGGGPAGREFFVLVEGTVAVGRGERKLADLGPGDWFGEIAILTYKPRTATVTATSPVRLLLVDDRAFRRVVETTPRIALKVLRNVAHRLEHDALS